MEVVVEEPPCAMDIPIAYGTPPFEGHSERNSEEDNEYPGPGHSERNSEEDNEFPGPSHSLPADQPLLLSPSGASRLIPKTFGEFDLGMSSGRGACPSFSWFSIRLCFRLRGF